jgi:hypothetical protein
MNKRIKELLAQSGLQPHETFSIQGVISSYDAQEDQIKKLVELIVEECSTIWATSNYNDDLDIMFKQHFGINCDD